MITILNPDLIPVADKSNLSEVLKELKATRELCQKLNMIIEYAPDGIYVTDGEANVIRINPAFEKMSGLRREDMLGRPSKELEESQLVLNSNHLEVVRQRKTVSNIVKYIPNNRTALVTSIPIFDEKGHIALIVSSTRDFTELNELKNKLAVERKRRMEYEKQIELIKNINSDKIIAVDKKMLNLLYKARRVASVDVSVLITGETGGGKEEFAKYIHANSLRAKGAFITINCGAIPEDLVESELFGYEKGAFTGARAEGKPGILEVANGGTVFLDEVGELPLQVQVKLLRALENRVIQHVGGTKSIPIDIRLISATNRNLEEMIEKGTFRDDLYYRLNVVPIRIPPLRERRDDIIPFVNHFLTGANKRYHLQKSFSNMAYRILYGYHWPGNVRELKNVIERVAVMSDDNVILAEELPMYEEKTLLFKGDMHHLPIKERLERIEYAIMNEACETNSTLRKAAKSLKMTWPTFIRKRKYYMEKFGAVSSRSNMKDT